ncbi:S66 family peptidase [Enterococcus sp. LJL120]
MIKGKQLKIGDTIAFISLSAGLAGIPALAYRWQIAKERLEKMGYHVVLTENALQSPEFLQAHPEKRAADLMAALKNPEIDAIFCMVGGADTIRLLPYIDFSVIKAHPKIFVGYSDTTINHFMFYHAGVTSIYGPAVFTQWAENVQLSDYTTQHFFDLVAEKKVPLQLESAPVWTSGFLDWNNPENQLIPRSWQPETHGHEFLQGSGTVSGTLLGGCLETFFMMMGTKIWPSATEWQGKILFIETSEMKISPEWLQIFLRGLSAQGIFHQLNGILMGKPQDEEYYQEYKDVLLEIIKDECQLPNLAIVYNLNFGHADPIVSLPFGCEVQIDCDQQTVALMEAAVE